VLRRDHVEQMRKVVDSMVAPNRKLKFAKAVAFLSHTSLLDDPRYASTELMNWGLRQRADDNVSYLAAMKQRIRFTTLEANQQQLRDQKPFGQLCFNAFKEYLGWSGQFPWDQQLYDECVQEFQERRGERPEALKKGSLNRADPDATLVMTAKTQWKLKAREFSEAKPLQPITIHSDKYIFEHGPYGIYLLKMLLRNSPDYWYLHAAKTPEDFDAWIKRHFNEDSTYQMNDQKGQDQSVQGWAVELMTNIMRLFSFPEEFIKAFEEDKLSKEVKGKILAIATNSGEIWTYIINSTSSAARECAMYGLRPGHPMGNGGDDLIRALFGALQDSYLAVAHMDPTVDKRYISPRGDFCSFIIKNLELFKDPVILLKRFLGKLSFGEGNDAVLGYFILWRFNYLKRDKLVEAFDETELEAHALMTRVMFNLKKEGVKIKPDYSTLSVDGEVFTESAPGLIFRTLDEKVSANIFSGIDVRQPLNGFASEYLSTYSDIASILASSYE